MVTREITLKTGGGLLSPAEAARLSRTAENFSSLIYVRRDNRWASVRSVTGLLELGLSDGDALTLIVRGGDEARALDKASRLLTGGLLR